MRESRFGFWYTWSDLRPVRALSVTLVIVQLLGSALGWFLLADRSAFERIWFGGAVATLPGFLLGAFVQSRRRPGSFAQSARLIRRLGFIAALIFVVAIGKRAFGLG